MSTRRFSEDSKRDAWLYGFDFADKGSFTASVNSPREHVWLLNPHHAEVRRTHGDSTRTLFGFTPTLEQEAKIDSGRGKITIQRAQIKG